MTQHSQITAQHPAPTAIAGRTTTETELSALFAAQKAAFAKQSYPSLEARRASLKALRACCAFVRKEITDALAADFGSHDPSIGLIWELSGVLGRIRHTSEKLEQWMQPSAREVNPMLGDASCYVRYQPKGVVGNMSPWNFPVDLSLGPLCDILAAGNRAIVKPSEWTPHCADLVRRAVEAHFDPSEVAVATGGLDLAQAFVELPWDHLLYTGNPSVARMVMAAAAKNLTPLTLELGGKCPAILAEDRVNADSIADILAVKAVKSGQVCINTDYVLVPESRMEDVILLIKDVWAKMFPSFVESPSATGIINTRHYDRLCSYVAQSKAQGVRVIELDTETPNRARRTLPLTLLVNPPDALRVMQEEIFGPLLPLKPYRKLDDAIAYVNAHERPLALYVFTDDANVADRVIAGTTSGGVCVNSIAAHAGVPSLPFGGIGHSGMGAHHGHEGFLTFSHARSVFRRGTVNAWEFMRPPWGEMAAAVAAAIVDAE